ncbi:MAG TPA: hypothetical protein VGK24_11175 [Candidatus Angelobacter sp.]
MALRRLTLIAVASLFVICALPALAQNPPDNSFKKLGGRLYCEAPARGSGCNADGSLVLALEKGEMIDRSYSQGPLPCCGGDENKNGMLVPIPNGVYMHFSGGRDGEWAVYNVRLMADATNVDDQGRVKAWTLLAHVYCGPSAAVGKGGCNGNAEAWIKVKKVN